MWMVLPSIQPSFARLSRNPASSAFDSASCAGVPITDLPHCRRLLCACGERPSHGAAAGKANKFAPSHGPSQVLRSGMVAGQTGSLEVVESALGDVRFGSKADIALVKSDVRFTPKRRHR